MEKSYVTVFGGKACYRTEMFPLVQRNLCGGHLQISSSHLWFQMRHKRVLRHWTRHAARTETWGATCNAATHVRSLHLNGIMRSFIPLLLLLWIHDRLWDLVVRVPGYGSRGPGFDSRRYQIFWQVVGLERGPLSLVSTIEELLGRKSRSSRCKKLRLRP
jgi:hypothetical protein